MLKTGLWQRGNNFKNNNIKDRILINQLDLITEIIIDIYFENERTHEKQESSKSS
jgi:hypothetical protein